jgi:hypothetical protein
MLREYYSELCNSVGTYEDDCSCTRSAEWMNNGLRPNHDWPVHHCSLAQFSDVQENIQDTLSLERELEEEEQEQAMNAWMNIDIFDYF